jgi:hypothetical protein
MLTTLRSMSNVQQQVRNMPSVTIPDNGHIPELVNSVSVLDADAIYHVSGYFCRKCLKLHNYDICRFIILDKEKLLVGEHQLFTYFRQSDALDYVNEGLLFPSNTVYQFLKIIELVHNENFTSLLKSNSLSEDFIHIIRALPNVPIINLCSEEVSNLFFIMFLKMRHHWGARLENRNKSMKIQNTNNQNLKNICQV